MDQFLEKKNYHISLKKEQITYIAHESVVSIKTIEPCVVKNIPCKKTIESNLFTGKFYQAIKRYNANCTQSENKGKEHCSTHLYKNYFNAKTRQILQKKKRKNYKPITYMKKFAKIQTKYQQIDPAIYKNEQ